MITFQGRTWPIVKRFDCIILELENENGYGGYFTKLPVSPVEYRRKNPGGRAKVEVRKTAKHTIFTITDDWRHEHVVKITNDMTEVIEAAISAARAQELMA